MPRQQPPPLPVGTVSQPQPRRYSLSLNYGEDPVNDHEEFCDAPVNAPCITKDHTGGCSLWYNVIYNCPTVQPLRCAKGYIYSGDNDKTGHVILVPTEPARGLEDLTDPAKSKNVIAKTEHLWTAFWTDSVNKQSGTGKGNTGFESKTTGALVINPPFYREWCTQSSLPRLPLLLAEFQRGWTCEPLPLHKHTPVTDNPTLPPSPLNFHAQASSTRCTSTLASACLSWTPASQR